MNDDDMHTDGRGRQYGVPQIRTISFHGDEIVTFEAAGKPHVAMRRIVENMKIDWASQAIKLRAQGAKFMCRDIPTGDTLGREQAMLAMLVEKLPLWLASINPNKIKNATIRAKVEEYQAESAIALHDYWTKGVAIKGDTDGIVTGFDPAVMTALGGMIKGILNKQLKETVPALVEHAMLEGSHVVSTDFRPALAVLEECRVPPRKRRAFSQKVSGRLRRFSTVHHLPLRLSRETGRYLFHIEAIKKWRAEEGDSLIREHVAKISGQGIFHLVPPDDPKPPKASKPSRRGVLSLLAGAALTAVGSAVSPKPAAALPAPTRDGLAIMTIKGETVTVDLNCFNIHDGHCAVVSFSDGEMAVEDVERRDQPMNWRGGRFAYTKRRFARPGSMEASHHGVWVIGAVVLG